MLHEPATHLTTSKMRCVFVKLIKGQFPHGACRQKCHSATPCERSISRWHQISSLSFTRSSSTESSNIRYKEVPEDYEHPSVYREGGFHPARIGDIVHNRNQVVDQLGFGLNCLVWLAKDLYYQHWAAMKICAARRSKTGADVLRDFATSVAGCKCPAIPEVLDEFQFKGPNGGAHLCHTTPAAS